MNLANDLSFVILAGETIAVTTLVPNQLCPKLR